MTRSSPRKPNVPSLRPQSPVGSPKFPGGQPQFTADSSLADILSGLLELSPIEGVLTSTGKPVPNKRYAPNALHKLREKMLIELIESRPDDRARIIDHFAQHPNAYTPSGIERWQRTEETWDRLFEESQQPQNRLESIAMDAYFLALELKFPSYGAVYLRRKKMEVFDAVNSFKADVPRPCIEETLSVDTIDVEDPATLFHFCQHYRPSWGCCHCPECSATKEAF